MKMMTRSEVDKKFKKIVADIFKVKVSEVKDGTRFAEDLKAKSLGMISLVAATETRFGIKTATAETSKNTTVKKAVDYIYKKLKEKEPKVLKKPIKKKPTKKKAIKKPSKKTLKKPKKKITKKPSKKRKSKK
jgi:acyl carrier protein